MPAGERVGARRSIEVYGYGRYFTLTGHRLNGTSEIAERTDEMASFCAKVFGPPPPGRIHPRHSTSVLSDAEIIERARSSANGAKFMRLWAGDTSEYDGDDSVADLALLGVLAFWTQDVDQLDRLFRRSGLYRPKWERSDYRARTIGKAVQPAMSTDHAHALVTQSVSGLRKALVGSMYIG